MKAYQKRLIKERNKLNKKLRKLVDFLESEEFTELPEETSLLLVTQSTIMASYVNILNTRIYKEGIEDERE